MRQDLRKPPAIATWLLRWVGIDCRDAPIIGDLFEEYGNGRSAFWFWGQTFMVILTNARFPGYRPLVLAHGSKMLALGTFSMLAAVFTTLTTLMVAEIPAANRAKIIHSNSGFAPSVALFAILLVGLCLLASLILLTWGRFRSALRMFPGGLGMAAAYAAVVMIIYLVAPRGVITVGGSYCHDSQCLRVENVRATPSAEEMLVEVDVSIFARVRWVRTLNSLPLRWPSGTASIYLIDDHGRRFAEFYELPPTLLHATLSPQQSVIHTSLKFLVSHEARQLFLTGDLWSLEDPWWVKLYPGDDFSLLHKQWLLRVI